MGTMASIITVHAQSLDDKMLKEEAYFQSVQLYPEGKDMYCRLSLYFWR